MWLGKGKSRNNKILEEVQSKMSAEVPGKEPLGKRLRKMESIKEGASEMTDGFVLFFKGIFKMFAFGFFFAVDGFKELMRDRRRKRKARGG